MDIGGRLGWLGILFPAFVSPCASVRSGVAPPCVLLQYRTVASNCSYYYCSYRSYMRLATSGYIASYR